MINCLLLNNMLFILMADSHSPSNEQTTTAQLVSTVADSLADAPLKF